MRNKPEGSCWSWRNFFSAWESQAGEGLENWRKEDVKYSGFCLGFSLSDLKTEPGFSLSDSKTEPNGSTGCKLNQP